MNRSRTRMLLSVAACVAVAALGAETLAQSQGVRPPAPQIGGGSPPVLLYYGVVVLLGAGTVVLSILNSKRGHEE